jgi:SAM-dependent methyltransferase
MLSRLAHRQDAGVPAGIGIVTTPMRATSFLQVAPARLRRGVGRRLLTAWCSLGNDVECCCCGWRGRSFLPGGVVVKRPNRKCPRCGSIERYRQLCLFLRERMGFLSQPQRVLDLAPPPYFRSFCRRLPHVTYVTADLMAQDTHIHTDLTALAFREQTFDLAICFHVFEHVRDDRAGMRELRRCLAPGGVALIQVPLRGAATFEDLQAHPSQYQELFGQSDHVRYYGLDIRDRLSEAGFEVQVIGIAAEFGPRDVERFGLGGDDRYLFVCRRPASGAAAGPLRAHGGAF